MSLGAVADQSESIIYEVFLDTIRMGAQALDTSRTYLELLKRPILAFLTN